MVVQNWTVASESGDEIVRHYAYTDVGEADAYNHAIRFGYAVWESHDGEPRYLIRRARPK